MTKAQYSFTMKAIKFKKGDQVFYIQPNSRSIELLTQSLLGEPLTIEYRYIGDYNEALEPAIVVERIDTRGGSSSRKHFYKYSCLNRESAIEFLVNRNGNQQLEANDLVKLDLSEINDDKSQLAKSIWNSYRSNDFYSSSYFKVVEVHIVEGKEISARVISPDIDQEFTIPARVLKLLVPKKFYSANEDFFLYDFINKGGENRFSLSSDGEKFFRNSPLMEISALDYINNFTECTI